MAEALKAHYGPEVARRIAAMIRAVHPKFDVRRSVANNLNDIGKDHPDLLFATAERWMKDANENRQRIIRHALRSAVKRGEPGALRVLGYGNKVKVAICNAGVSPARVRKGDAVQVQFDVAGAAPQPQRLLVDLRVHYVKANGKASAKVFKLRTLTLAGKATESFSRRLSLKNLTTRKHYPGTHKVEVLINGTATALGSFELLAR